MLDNLVRGLLRQVAWNLGALLTFAGLIPPGMQAFDVLTTKPAVAGVEKVGHICQKTDLRFSKMELDSTSPRYRLPRLGTLLRVPPVHA